MSGRVGSITTGIITNGLVFNMDPANRASYPKNGTIITDTISNISSGSFESDPIFVEDIAIDYDGTDDYLQVGPSVSLNGNFTISWWYKNTSGGTPSSYRNFVGGFGAFQYGLTMNSGVWKTYTAGSPTWEPMSGNILSGWHNLTAVNDNDNTNWTSYHNGQFFKTITRNYSSNGFSKIGRYSSAIRYILGSIGTVYAYNRCLSASEVLHNYNALRDRFGV